jgi:hypothetical protein
MKIWSLLRHYMLHVKKEKKKRKKKEAENWGGGVTS